MQLTGITSPISTLLPACLAVLASCVTPAPPDAAAAPVAVAKPKVASVPKVADLCIMRSRTVCALLEDGRVTCAQIVEDRFFRPPLAGITGAVEIACGEHSICARDAAGAITCLDQFGELHRLDSLAKSRALAPDCAVAQDGALFCWDESLEISLRSVPRVYADKLHDLQRVTVVDYRGDGCALKRDGELWCWLGVLPKIVAELEHPEDVRELKLDDNGNVCWRGAGEWSCTDGQSEPWPGFKCDYRACTCAFQGGRCITHYTEIPESMTVHDVVLYDDPCVVDRLGRLLCQRGDQPPYELSLPLTDETSARYEPFVPPPPDPDPLPNPELSDCPKAVVVSNRVCEHFSEPGGPLHCRKGQSRCQRYCALDSVSHSTCEPDGFVIISAGGGSSFDTYNLVYVDGSRVSLGPRLEMEAVDWAPGASRTAPTTFELEKTLEGGSTYYLTDHQLSAVMVCGLVDDRPACSLPIARDWRLESVVWDEDNGEETDRESIHYQADVAVTSTDVSVTVRAGKRHASSSHNYAVGTRILPTGTHSLASLLDQPFVDLPE
jgi:hypothetical protein